MRSHLYQEARRLRRSLLASLVIFISFGWALPVYAEDGGEVKLGDEFSAWSGADMLLKLILSLAVITVLLWLLVRFVARRQQTVTGGKAIRNLGGVSVGANKSVQLIEVGDRLYVIGVGEQVQHIDRIDDPVQLKAIYEARALEQSSANWRPAWWDKLFHREEKKQPEHEATSAPSANFHEMFHDKMKHMQERREQVQRQWERENRE